MFRTIVVIGLFWTISVFSAASEEGPPAGLPELPSGDTEVLHKDVLPEKQFSAAVSGRYRTGANMMVVFVDLAAGDEVGWHSHAAEQITSVLSGVLQFTIGSDAKPFVLRAGDTIVIAPNVPHKAVALEATSEFDVFSPRREEWLAQNPASVAGAKVFTHPEQ